MDWIQVVSAVAAAFVLGSLGGMYNRLVGSRNACDESWADIATELKRRYDLVPNLVETVKGYTTHERETLEGVIKARNAAASNVGPRGSQATDERNLEGRVRGVFALAERYPALAASENFQSLHDELTDCEDRIQRARRFYNSNVRALADLREMFPSNVIAAIFRFDAREYFAPGDDAVDGPVEVTFERIDQREATRRFL